MPRPDCDVSDFGGDVGLSFGRQAFENSLKTDFEAPHELQSTWSGGWKLRMKGERRCQCDEDEGRLKKKLRVPGVLSTPKNSTNYTGDCHE